MLHLTVLAIFLHLYSLLNGEVADATLVGQPEEGLTTNYLLHITSTLYHGCVRTRRHTTINYMIHVVCLGFKIEMVQLFYETIVFKVYHYYYYYNVLSHTEMEEAYKQFSVVSTGYWPFKHFPHNYTM